MLSPTCCLMHAGKAQQLFDSVVRDIAQGSKRAALLQMPDLLQFCNPDGGLLAQHQEPQGTFDTFQEHQEVPADEDEPMPGPSSAHADGNSSDVDIGGNTGGDVDIMLLPVANTRHPPSYSRH